MTPSADATTLATRFAELIKAIEGLDRTLQSKSPTAEPKRAPSGFAAFDAAMASLGKVLNPVGAAIAGIGKAAGVVLKPITGAIGAIAELGNSLGAFVSKANPAAMLRFGMAVDDAMAVLGRAVSPAMEGLTGLARALGDGLAADHRGLSSFAEGLKALFDGLRPVMQLLGQVAGVLSGALAIPLKVVAAAVKALQPAIDAVTNIFRVMADVLSALDPIVNLVTQSLAAFGKVLEGIAQSRLGRGAIGAGTGALIGSVIPGIGTAIGAALGGLAGLFSPSPDRQRASSMGAAVRPAQFVGAEELGKRALLSAFMASPEKSQQQKQTEALNRQEKHLANMDKRIGAIAEALGAAVKGQREAQRQASQQFNAQQV
jgi:hypothetical protein